MLYKSSPRVMPFTAAHAAVLFSFAFIIVGAAFIGFGSSFFGTKIANASTCDSGSNLSYEQTVTALSNGTLSVNFVPDTVNNTVTAAVTNNTSCGVSVSLGTYKMYGAYDPAEISLQEFFSGSQTAVVQPGATLTLNAALPTCMAQYDLFYGDVPHSLAGQLYGSYIVGSHENVRVGQYCVHVGTISGSVIGTPMTVLGGTAGTPSRPFAPSVLQPIAINSSPAAPTAPGVVSPPSIPAGGGPIPPSPASPSVTVGGPYYGSPSSPVLAPVVTPAGSNILLPEAGFGPDDAGGLSQTGMIVFMTMVVLSTLIGRAYLYVFHKK